TGRRAMTDLIISNGPSMVIKATVLLGSAVAAPRLLRRRASAATRHFVLTLAVVGVLLLPAMSLVAPEWGFAHRVVEAGSFRLKAEATGVEALKAEATGTRESDTSFRLKAEATGTADQSSTEIRSPWRPPSGGTSSLLVLLYISGVALSVLHLLAQRLR